MLEKNDLILFNEIIYKIHTIKDFEEMRRTFLTLLKSLVPYRHATFCMASATPGGSLFSDPIIMNLPEEKMQQYFEKFEDIDYTRWIFLSAKSMVFRETDLFSDDKRESDAFYKSLYEPFHIHFSAQLSIASNDTFLGVVSLYRAKEDGDFSDQDILILDLLKEHLTCRLQNYPSEGGKLSESKELRRSDNVEYITRYHLTLREVEVFNLLIKGLANDKICELLCISSHTLKKHTLNIYRKLGVNNRWELYNLHPDGRKE